MGKNEICWAMFSGPVLLPFSIRTTKFQCLNDYCRHVGHDVDPKDCRKIVINEWKKPSGE